MLPHCVNPSTLWCHHTRPWHIIHEGANKNANYATDTALMCSGPPGLTRYTAGEENLGPAPPRHNPEYNALKATRLENFDLFRQGRLSPRSVVHHRQISVIILSMGKRPCNSCALRFQETHNPGHHMQRPSKSSQLSPGGRYKAAPPSHDHVFSSSRNVETHL